MPTTVSLYACGVWILVGVCTGAGWAFGHWLIGRLLTGVRTAG